MVKRDIFHDHGPKFLNRVDWENSHHRSCVTASLVQGVYILERDRKKKRHGRLALACPWWESFHFRLVEPLEDHSGTIFGAIYEYQSQNSSSSFTNSAPKYVIAFRGTLPKLRDIKLDIKMVFNYLHNESCFLIGMLAVEKKVNLAGGSSIWLAGHSLGSAMAMLIGKTMAKMNSPIKTYLFNPPFISIPIEWIEVPQVKYGIRLLTSGLRLILPDLYQGPQYDQLSSWVPFLFVNQSDVLCKEYIKHFKRRENGMEGIERHAMHYLISNIIVRIMGKNPEPLMHLLPSAHLSINQRPPTKNLIEAHGLHQWWSKDLHCQSEEFHFRMQEMEANST